MKKSEYTKPNYNLLFAIIIAIPTLMLLMLLLPSCKSQQPYTKPLIERKLNGKGQSTIIIRERSCGNHKDKYPFYIVLSPDYERITKSSLKPTLMYGYIQNDTLFIFVDK